MISVCRVWFYFCGKLFSYQFAIQQTQMWEAQKGIMDRVTSIIFYSSNNRKANVKHTNWLQNNITCWQESTAKTSTVFITSFFSLSSLTGLDDVVAIMIPEPKGKEIVSLLERNITVMMYITIGTRNLQKYVSRTSVVFVSISFHRTFCLTG